MTHCDVFWVFFLRKTASEQDWHYFQLPTFCLLGQRFHCGVDSKSWNYAMLWSLKPSAAELHLVVEVASTDDNEFGLMFIKQLFSVRFTLRNWTAAVELPPKNVEFSSPRFFEWIPPPRDLNLVRFSFLSGSMMILFDSLKQLVELTDSCCMCAHVDAFRSVNNRWKFLHLYGTVHLNVQAIRWYDNVISFKLLSMCW